MAQVDDEEAAVEVAVAVEAQGVPGAAGGGGGGEADESLHHVWNDHVVKRFGDHVITSAPRSDEKNGPMQTRTQFQGV